MTDRQYIDKQTIYTDRQYIDKQTIYTDRQYIDKQTIYTDRQYIDRMKKIFLFFFRKQMRITHCVETTKTRCNQICYYLNLIIRREY